MDAPLNNIFFPVSFSELFSVWSRFPSAVIFAGGTDLIYRQGKNLLELPQVIICLDKIEELHRITRTEHYMEIGPMIKLNKITNLGKIVPEVLCACLENIAGYQLRNIATIGGNVCCHSRLLDASAPLTALDAQYELRNANNTRWVAASRFHSLEEHSPAADAPNPRQNARRSALETQELLTRIRLPIQQWNYSFYKKFFSQDSLNTNVLIFIAKTAKNVLSDIRVIFKGNAILRNRNGENILTGKNLPLSRKTAVAFVDNWNVYLTGNKVDDYTKYKLLNSIEENIFNLSE